MFRKWFVHKFFTFKNVGNNTETGATSPNQVANAMPACRKLNSLIISLLHRFHFLPVIKSSFVRLVLSSYLKRLFHWEKRKRKSEFADIRTYLFSLKSFCIRSARMVHTALQGEKCSTFNQRLIVVMIQHKKSKE